MEYGKLNYEYTCKMLSKILANKRNSMLKRRNVRLSKDCLKFDSLLMEEEKE